MITSKAKIYVFWKKIPFTRQCHYVRFSLLIKLFFVFHPILMKVGEIVVHMDNFNFTKFHQNKMKNKKVLLIARFSVQNFKVSVESWKSYIVRLPYFGNSFEHYAFGTNWLGLICRQGLSLSNHITTIKVK